MTRDRPDFVPTDAEWRPVNVRFNSVPIILYRTEADSRNISGWTDNPRIELVLKRWRNRNHMSPDAMPDDEQMLELMLEDDASATTNKTFSIQELGEDVKRNGVRDPITVTWDGRLLDGNRRKFAVMWALSDRGGASNEHLTLLRRVPMMVLRREASSDEEKSILIQENYAESLKKEWPPVVTNGALYNRHTELYSQFPNEGDLAIRRRLQRDFPRFGITDIRDRINTWNLIEEFKTDYSDDVDQDELEALINDRFQYFRQANDTFGRSEVFQAPGFKELLFKGICHGLFPSFASVRSLADIYNGDRASQIFSEGEGMSPAQKRTNYRRARDEAGRERANRDLTLDRRLEETIDFLDAVTSKQLAEISVDLRERLEDALHRIVSQAAASPADNSSDDGTDE